MINKYKRLLVFFDKKELNHLGILFIGTLLLGAIEVAGVVSIVPFMAIVTSPSIIHDHPLLAAAYEYFEFSNNTEFIQATGIVLLLVIGFSNAYSAFIRWLTVRFVQIQGHKVSTRLLSHYLSQPYIFFLNRNTTDLGKNILIEVARVINGVIMPVMTSLSKFIITVFIIILLIVVDPILAITVAGVLGGSYIVIFKLVQLRLHNIGVATTESVTQRFQIANEAMSGVKDVKLKGAEGEFIRRFIEPSESFASYSTISTLISELPRYLLETIAFGGIVAIIIYFSSKEDNAANVIPLVSLYAMAGFRLLPALQQMFQGFAQARYNYPAMKILIDDFTMNDNEIRPPHAKSEILPFNDSLKLDSINFSYPQSNRTVINNLNLTIDINTTVGFVGTTGSGKTTLIDILLGLLSPDSGKLLVDDVVISDENLNSWQVNLGYVPQAIYLSDDTIENNIAFAIPNDEIDKNRVVDAAKIAELNEFIDTLPDGYQTQVGERGVRLSGGQRQRIGIARALYNDPKILILDEATSALDGLTENIIMETINNFVHKKTIIMIAHRLTTVRECDAIYMMESGKIIDSGTYSELISRNEKFRNMASDDVKTSTS